jgi:hypothetical protein
MMAYSPEPLKSKPTGGGDIPPPRTSSEVDVLHRMVEAAEQHATHWEAECGRLREQLDASETERKKWMEAALKYGAERIAHKTTREQLDALANEAESYVNIGHALGDEDKPLREAIASARAALGKE